MGTYQIPRNTKGEGRLFYIFSTKALIYTVAGIIIGVIIRYILKAFGSAIAPKSSIFSTIGIIIIVLLAAAGFVIGTCKMPKTDRFEITRKAGGINLDKIIVNSIKFKFRKDKIYVFNTNELMREEIKNELKEQKENEEKMQKDREKLREENLRKQRGGYIK